MSLALIHSRALVGVNAPQVTIETHLASGLPVFNMVGLAETSVKESKDRVRSAIVNSGFEFPARRITLNLAPADLPKDGGRFDLAIALGILAASGQIDSSVLDKIECLGELALSGAIRPVQGVLPATIAAKKAGRSILIPLANAEEASMVSDIKIFAADNLKELIKLINQSELVPYKAAGLNKKQAVYPDLADVQGQQAAKRALLIAAAGGHNMLMIGPPGTGKTLLASRLPSILPPLNEQQAQEVAAIASVTSHQPLTSWPLRPFRSPHHSASAPALVGGGSKPSPGEITLAHLGVLFLDELPEFDRKVLEVLREPLETGHIVIARAKDRVCFPARFQLIAAMNPCPCGYLHDPTNNCICTPEQIRRYRGKISNPLLDRIDLHITVTRETTSLKPNNKQQQVTSAELAKQVTKAQQIQLDRQKTLNSELDLNSLNEFCWLTNEDRLWLEQACERLGMSLRAAHRLLKVARTIADLDAKPNIERVHLAESLQYRSTKI